MAERWIKTEKRDIVEYEVEDTIIVRIVNKKRLEEERRSLQDNIELFQKEILRIDRDLDKITEIEKKD